MIWQEYNGSLYLRFDLIKKFRSKDTGDIVLILSGNLYDGSDSRNFVFNFKSIWTNQGTIEWTYTVTDNNSNSSSVTENGEPKWTFPDIKTMELSVVKAFNRTAKFRIDLKELKSIPELAYGS